MSGPFRHSLLRFALLLGVCSTGAAAADEVHPIRLTDVGGFVELAAESKNEERSRPGAETSFESDQLKLEQIFRLDLSGDVYHPRFLKYRGGLEITTLQRPVNEGDDRFVSGDADRLLLGGDARLSILEQHPYGLVLLGKSYESEVEQTFARSYDLTSEVYAATFFLRKGPLPLKLSYNHRSRQGSGAGDEVDEDGDDVSAVAHYRLGDDSRGDLEYHLTQEHVLQRDLRRQEFFAGNTTSFDDKERKTFRGQFRFFEQSDVLDTRTTTAFGGFDWRHRKNLSTGYRVDFQRSDAAVQVTNNWNVGMVLSHRLFESLSTVADVYGRFDDDSFGETRTYGASVAEDYTKRLGGWGRLGFSAVPSAEFEQRRPRETTAIVFDEELLMEAGSAVELRQRNVNPGSIRVTDEQGSELFVENEDYVVTVRDGVTELRRLPTGDIAEGELVLVDYSYSLAAPGDVLTSGVRVRADLSVLNALTVFGRVESSNQSITGGDIHTPLESRDRQVAGAKVRRSWLAARAQYERVRSSFSSYRVVSEYLSLFTSGRRWWRVRVSGTHSYLAYDDTDEKVRRFGVTTALRARPAREVSLEVEGSYQRDTWGGDPTFSSNDLDAFGVKASLAWRYRRVHVNVEGRISRVNRHDQSEDNGRVFLRLRREF